MTEPDQSTAFDPQDENVQPVLDYLADADPAERARVLFLERTGKARATILAAYPAGDPAEDEPVPGDTIPAPEGLEGDGYDRVLVSSPAFPEGDPEMMAELVAAQDPVAE